MPIWYRIFARSAVPPTEEEILGYLRRHEPGAAGTFHGDREGWFRAELTPGGRQLELERYLAEEEGMRAELNSWAAWLETCTHSPHHGTLMEHMIQTAQLFTLTRPGADEADPFCVGLCRFLAGLADGVYQVDGQGMCAADGTLLVEERG